MAVPVVNALLRRLLTALAALAFGVAAQAAAPRGFIVELKDATPHGAPERNTALHAEKIDAAALQRERVQRVIAAAGVAPVATRPQGRAAHVLDFGRSLSPAETDAILERLRASPEIAWAEPNDRERVLHNTTPSDPYFAGTNGQWWLHPAGGTDANRIDARLRGVPGIQRAWTWATGSAAVPVAVLDTGITAHPELQGMWLSGADMVSDPQMANDGGGRDLDPTDPGDWVSASESAQDAFSGCDTERSSWHGTVVSGILAARTDNNEGVAAVGWDARIVPVRVAGKCGAEVADIVDGMRWAAGLWVRDGYRGWLPLNPNPVRLINLSFGGNKPCSAAYQSTIDELRARGVLVVTAAGNGQGAVMRPANCLGVVAVAALNRDGFKARYSNFGSEVTLATVGGDNAGASLGDGGLLSLFNAGTAEPGDNIYARSFGTSFATPVVAGTAALMLSINPDLTLEQLVDGLRRSARPHVVSPWLQACSMDNSASCLCTASTCGAGMLDAEQALFYARDPAGYVPPARNAEVLDSPELAAGAEAPQASPQPTLDAAPQAGGGALGALGLLALACAVWALGRVKAASRTA
ncbi:MAG: S8 family peptidase [Burkholderiaceae bacterium]|nr:S8 family peptidase [Burkholderiaceae bacterium]